MHNIKHQTIGKNSEFISIKSLNRRDILFYGMAGGLFTLSGCASLPGFGLTDTLRRLMALSSQRAFAQLIEPGGFYDDQLTRIALPDQFGGGAGSSLLSTVLSSGKVRTKLQQQVNRVAEKGAERAAPYVADTIKTIGIEGASQIIKGGPSAATEFLRGNIGNNLIGIMVPGINDGLKLFDNGLISQAVRSVAGFDVGKLGNDIVGKAGNSIWSAMGREEAAIRANPRETGDPLLIAAFALAG